MKDTRVYENLMKNGIVGFTPNGNSMWPFIKGGKTPVVIVKKSGKLKKFDVAFYVRDNGDFVLHRCVDIVDGGYIFQGDSQDFTEFIAEEKVFGVMKGFYKNKEFTDSFDCRYNAMVNKWYGDEKYRKRKIKSFHFKIRLYNLFHIIIGSKKRIVY